MVPDASTASEIKARWKAFRLLAPYFGKIVSASFIQKTQQVLPGITRVHNLIEGIYKPRDAAYAFSIASMLTNPYADRISYKPDRSWSFEYSPKEGSLESKVNQSLFNCMRDNEPVLVLKQLTIKTANQGTTYKLLGLGLVEDYDASNRLFRIREVTIDGFYGRIAPGELLSDDLIETALQLETLEEWTPFVAEDRAVYHVDKQKRDAAFRKIVRSNYANTCAVTRSRFVYDKSIEVEAAHIIDHSEQGTDDPRNGIALSRTAHWAFGEGLFTISDQYEIVVHPKARDTNLQTFPILASNGEMIRLPEDTDSRPHPEALEWHRKERFGRFCKEN